MHVRGRGRPEARFELPLFGDLPSPWSGVEDPWEAENCCRAANANHAPDPPPMPGLGAWLAQSPDTNSILFREAPA